MSITGPFTSGFLQPGTYPVLVNGFAPGPPPGEAQIVDFRVYLDGMSLFSRICNCYQTSSFQVGTIDVGTLTRGTPHTLRVQARTANAKTAESTKSFVVGTDTTPPSITLAGALFDERVPGPLDPGALPLTVTASDGMIGANANGASGVKSVQVSVGSQVVVPAADQPCTAPPGGTCDRSVTYTLNTAAFTEGSYVVNVQATDQSGNTSSRQFSILIDDSAAVDLGTPDDGACGADPETGVNDCADNEPPETVGAFAAASPPAFGIADNNALSRYDMFADTDFINLGVVQVRRTLPYNIALFDPPAAGGTPTPGYLERVEATQWVHKALTSGKLPFIAFDRCRYPSPGQTDPTFCRKPPSYNDYTAAIRKFLSASLDQDPATRELSDVKLFSAWNEPNNGLGKLDEQNPIVPANTGYEPLAYSYSGSGTVTKENSGAFMAGRLTRYLDIQCRLGTPDRCSVAAGDFLDAYMRDARTRTSDGGRYLSQYRRGLNRVPKYWAWHAYTDGVTASSIPDSQAARRWKLLRSFVSATVPQNGAAAPPIWLTEQGAIFKSDNAPTNLPEAVGAKIVRLYAQESWTVSTRIRRFYLYQMLGEDEWDSGLKEYSLPGLPRRALVYGAYCKRTDPNRTC